MKVDWRTCPLGNLCRIVSGTTPDTSASVYWGGDYLWITPTDLGALNGRFIASTARTVTDRALSDHRLDLVPPGSIVMSSRAPIGHLAITTKRACMNQGCKAFVCGGEIEPTFLYWMLAAHKPRLQELGRGATFDEISKGFLEAYEIRVPNSDEQRRVAVRLDQQAEEMDKAKASAAEQVASASLLAKKILVEAFGSIPPIRSWPSSSKVNRGDWNQRPLLDVARLESGHTPSRRHPEWWGGQMPWLALPDIRKLHGKYAYETAENTNDAGLAHSAARMLPAGTVCLSRTASVGFVTILGRPMATSQDFANWVCDPKKLDPEFLMYTFMASQDYLRELGSGAVHKTIYMPTIESFQVCAPDIGEQHRIARTLRERLIAAEALSEGLKTRLTEIERLPQRLLAAAFGESG